MDIASSSDDLLILNPAPSLQLRYCEAPIGARRWIYESLDSRLSKIKKIMANLLKALQHITNEALLCCL